MPAVRLTMRKVKEVLRLKWEGGLSDRQIAKSCGIARPTVADYLRRASAAGVSWPLPAGLDEGTLERLLFPPSSLLSAKARPLPDWAELQRELKRPGVTLALLWQEHKAVFPEGYQYSAFCQHYRAWQRQVDLVMRQTHRAGEKLFVDYAGQTVPIVERTSGECHPAQLFVAVLGASNYTYAEATWTQTLPDWIGSHVRTFAYLGGVPELLVPDNLKSGVTAAHRYEPDLNPTYQDLAAHYGVAVIPARVRKPRDKAKAEVGVQVVERWILARLRHHTFFSLTELNAALRALLPALNSRPFKKLPGCRQTLFEQLERPLLKPLPVEPYLYAEWQKVRVHIDYHVDVDGHYYSVPYQLVQRQLEARLTAHTVELLHKGQRVASHVRSYQKGHHTTVTGHMPKAHQAYAHWTPQRLLQWAGENGPATAQVVATILASRPHAQQGFRSCLGIMRLGQTYGQDRLEAACRRAQAIHACSYKSLAAILKNKLDQAPLPTAASATPVLAHPYIRGAHYYH
jgi:transposase